MWMVRCTEGGGRPLVGWVGGRLPVPYHHVPSHYDTAVVAANIAITQLDNDVVDSNNLKHTVGGCRLSQLSPLSSHQ